MLALSENLHWILLILLSALFKSWNIMATTRLAEEMKWKPINHRARTRNANSEDKRSLTLGLSSKGALGRPEGQGSVCLCAGL